MEDIVARSNQDSINWASLKEMTDIVAQKMCSKVCNAQDENAARRLIVQGVNEAARKFIFNP